MANVDDLLDDPTSVELGQAGRRFGRSVRRQAVTAWHGNSTNRPRRARRRHTLNRAPSRGRFLHRQLARESLRRGHRDNSARPDVGSLRSRCRSRSLSTTFTADLSTLLDDRSIDVVAVQLAALPQSRPRSRRLTTSSETRTTLFVPRACGRPLSAARRVHLSVGRHGKGAACRWRKITRSIRLPVRDLEARGGDLRAPVRAPAQHTSLLGQTLLPVRTASGARRRHDLCRAVDGEDPLVEMGSPGWPRLASSPTAHAPAGPRPACTGRGRGVQRGASGTGTPLARLSRPARSCRCGGVHPVHRPRTARRSPALGGGSRKAQALGPRSTHPWPTDSATADWFLARPRDGSARMGQTCKGGREGRRTYRREHSRPQDQTRRLDVRGALACAARSVTRSSCPGGISASILNYNSPS
jgi:hypothetical protein